MLFLKDSPEEQLRQSIVALSKNIGNLQNENLQLKEENEIMANQSMIGGELGKSKGLFRRSGKQREDQKYQQDRFQKSFFNQKKWEES